MGGSCVDLFDHCPEERYFLVGDQKFALLHRQLIGLIHVVDSLPALVGKSLDKIELFKTFFKKFQSKTM